MNKNEQAAIDKVVSFAKKLERVKEVDMVEPVILGVVAEPKFQYGAEVFESDQISR